jgi:hypothetical protein
MAYRASLCSLCFQGARDCVPLPTCRPALLAPVCADCMRAVALFLHADAPLCRPCADFLHGL